MPNRVQRTRTSGQPGMPPGAIYVGRGQGDYGKWGNPFTVAPAASTRGGPQDMWAVEHQGRSLGRWDDKTAARADAVDRYARWMREPDQAPLVEAARTELAGLDLACWCPLPEPGQPDHCHAAVLLELANGGAS